MKSLTYKAHVFGRPCSVNRMYRHNRRGQVYLTDAASDWELAVVTDVRQQIDTAALRASWRIDRQQPQIAIAIAFWGVRADADNLLKSTLDGLKQALGIDDKYYSPVTAAVESRAGHGYRSGAHIEITIPAVPAVAALNETPPPDDDDDDLPPAATQQQTDEPTETEEGGWRVADLIDTTDPQAPALVRPVEHVTIWPVPAYDSIVVMFPPSRAAETAQWGAFLPCEQARELRDRLVEMGDALEAVPAAAAAAAAAPAALPAEPLSAWGEQVVAERRAAEQVMRAMGGGQ